jgi:hypothetical protein
MTAHEDFRNLNLWIWHGVFPSVDPTLSQEPDLICPSCIFGEACQHCHKTHTGHISHNHIFPGQGVIFDGLESGTPGHPFTTKGLPSKLGYNYASLWVVDHVSTFVYITFHSSKAATE